MESFRKNLKWYLLGILLLANLLIWRVIVTESSDDILTVAFLDVGQGDAIFIETPSGRQVLIDGGPGKSVLPELSRVMPFYDRSIDVLVLSHPHLDHLRGLLEVLKRYNVEFILASGDKTSSAEFAEWEKLIGEKNISEISARRGTRVFLGNEIHFDVLLPNKLSENNDPHLNMVVGRLSYQDVCFIFTGDMERNLEFKILQDNIDCEVLKVGHHGSKTSTSEAFLEAVSPEIAVIQTGIKNRYGHPHDAILKTLSASVPRIFRTDTDGAIILKSNGKDIKIKK